MIRWTIENYIHLSTFLCFILTAGSVEPGRYPINGYSN